MGHCPVHQATTLRKRDDGRGSWMVLSAAVIVLDVRGPVLIQVSGKGDNATGPMVVLTSLAVAWFVIV
jgi:hypothetical protein